MKLRFVKMIYTNNYDTFDKKGKRPLLRAYLKAGVNELVENDCPFVLGYVCEGMLFDAFTNREISINGNLVEIDDNELKCILDTLDNEKKEMISDIIKVMFFNEKVDLGFDISTMYEVADDRKEQWVAYQNGLTEISPYDMANVNNYTASKVKKYNLK